MYIKPLGCCGTQGRCQDALFLTDAGAVPRSGLPVASARPRHRSPPWANGTMRNAFTLYVTHPDVELHPGVALLGSFTVPSDR